MISKPQEHDTNRAGKRLLRAAVEELGWVATEVPEDYVIDYNIQVFDKDKEHRQVLGSMSS